MVKGWGIAQVLFAVTMVAIGQLCMRRGMVELEPIASASALAAALASVVANPSIAFWASSGVAAYVLATFA